MSSRINTRSSATRVSVVLRNLHLASLFRPEDILHNCQATDDRDAVRQLLMHLALEYGIGNFSAAQKEVDANLEKDSPHIAPGVAVAYGRLEKIPEPLLSMATFPGGLEFAGRPVRIAVLVLTPADMPGVHKQIFHSLSQTFSDAAVAGAVAALPSPLAVWQHFEQKGHKLPDHLQARHIMSAPSVFLGHEDSLARAIDLFLSHKVSELPVLAADRELIGVVTTRRLVKVCMPDYLAWIEDMRPFQNFEPIAELIRRKSTTWLREIMVQDYAQVTEKSPAILALKEINRRETDNAYVLRDKKLVGIIHLHEFLNSILR